MSRQNILKLAISLLTCYLAGAIGLLFTRPAVEFWYQSLVKPGFSPPDWLLAPVWLVLYALMGIAVYSIWRSGLEDKSARTAFVIFFAHLVMNVGWSIVFFGFQNIFWGLMTIIILWGFILVLLIAFSQVRKLAAALLVPYWLWVAFAGVLNWYIWLLN